MASQRSCSSCPTSIRRRTNQGRAIAALTVPYAERIDQIQRKSIPEVTVALGLAARTLSTRIGGMVSANGLNVPLR
jgi:hypothetical protein